MVLTIYRTGRTTLAGMERVIGEIWEAPENIYCEEFGVLATTEAIIQGFNMVNNAFCPSGSVLFHLFEITSSILDDRQMMLVLAHQLAEYLSNRFQVITVVKQCRNVYKVIVLLNAVSYQDGKKFHDNNNSYINIVALIEKITGRECRINACTGGLFDRNRDNTDCYISYRKEC